MANVPNIPSVVVSIEDNSYLQPILSSGRTVLFPFFSKYGKDEFVEWSTWDEFVSRFGAANPRKYGMSQVYIKGASQFTQSFLGKRIMPTDSTYANTAIINGTGISSTEGDEAPTPGGVSAASTANVVDTAALACDADNPTEVIFYGTGKGSGYNDLVIKFNPLNEYTRFYADDNGIPNYQFNFLEATIFEKQSDGSLIQIEQNSVPFALVDIDPQTGATIKDIYDGKSLNIEDRFSEISELIGAYLCDSQSELSKALSPKDLDGIKTLWDAKANKSAYIIFEDSELTIEYVGNQKTDDVADQLRFEYTSASGTTKYAILQISGGKIVLTDDTAAGSQDGDLHLFPIFSDDAYYQIGISDSKGTFAAADEDSIPRYEATAKEGQIFVTVPFTSDNPVVIVDGVIMQDGVDYNYTNDNTIEFLKPLTFGQNITVIGNSKDIAVQIFQQDNTRAAFWRYLIDNGIQLAQGSDGENLYINNVLNFDGPGETGKENAKMLLVDFYSSNEIIREVLYPKYNFDYVPDFTMDSDVQAAIVGLCDYLQTAFGIHSTGITYDYKSDLNYRKYNLGMSSFCNMLYNGEANKRQYNADIGGTIVMPSNYYAMLDHLYVDGAYDIADPVAGITKGEIRSGSIKLTYVPTTLQIEKMRMKQLNTIISEPDGIYFIDQLTMYKKASILSRIHAVKPIMQVKKDLRKLLKDVLQSKDGKTSTSRVDTIIDEYMKDKIYDAQKNRRGWFEYYKVAVNFDEDKLQINVLLTVKPLRSVEKVSVTIGVV